MIKSVVLIFILAMLACSKSPVPKGILRPEEMEKVVGDVIQVDEFINNFLLKDTLLDMKKRRTQLYEKVFLLHKTSRKEFYTSLKYYQAHPNIQKALFDSLSSHLNSVKLDTVKPESSKTIKVQ